MGKRIDLTGQRFGRRKVLTFAFCSKRRGTMWWYECDCGAYGLVSQGNLKHGGTESCGCLKKERQRREHQKATTRKTKQCPSCKKEISKEEYGAGKVGTNGFRRGKCKDCRKTHYRTTEGRVRARATMYKSKYGITLKKYSDMLASQNGVCAICGTHEQSVQFGKVVELSVDHNHITGEVRGLLCMACNQGLGQLQADKGCDLLEAAIKYINQNKSNNLEAVG